MRRVPTPTHPEDLDVPAATFCSPDLTTFTRLNELGLVVVGRQVTARRPLLECRVVAGDDDAFCRRCGAEGVVRDSVTRNAGARAVRVATHDLAGAGAPVPLLGMPACVARGHLGGGAAAGEAVPSGGALGAGWPGRRTPDRSPPGRGSGRGLGYRERCRPGRKPAEAQRRPGPLRRRRDDRRRRARVATHPPGRQVRTVVIDLTPIRDGVGPARLLDMVEGRCKQTFKQWRADRPKA